MSKRSTSGKKIYKSIQYKNSNVILSNDDFLIPSHYRSTFENLRLPIKQTSEMLILQDAYDIERLTKKIFPKIIKCVRQKTKINNTEGGNQKMNTLFEKFLKGKTFFVSTQLSELYLEVQIQFTDDGKLVEFTYTETGQYSDPNTDDYFSDTCIFVIRNILLSNEKLIINLDKGKSQSKLFKPPTQIDLTVYPPNYDKLQISSVRDSSKRRFCVIQSLCNENVIFVHQSQ